MKIKLPYLTAYRSDGKLYFYVRRRGKANVRLSGLPGSAEFMASYQAALASNAPGVCRHGAGSFGKLVMDFYASVEFANLKPSSKKAYRLVLDTVAAKHGHRPAATLPGDYARKMIEEIGHNRPGLANLTRSVMRRVMQFAIAMRVRNDNPFAGVPTYTQGTYHTWSDAELRSFEARWPLGTRQRLAYALLLYTGQRGGDVVRMRRQDISEGTITVVQEKTGTELSIPIHPNLEAAIKAGPSHIHYLIVGQDGRPMTRKALTDMMKRAVKAAGLGAECVPHGLRKAVLRRLAECGSTTKEIAAVSGHKTLREVERYTAAADQRRLSAAAIKKLWGE